MISSCALGSGDRAGGAGPRTRRCVFRTGPTRAASGSTVPAVPRETRDSPPHPPWRCGCPSACSAIVTIGDPSSQWREVIILRRCATSPARSAGGLFNVRADSRANDRVNEDTRALEDPARRAAHPESALRIRLIVRPSDHRAIRAAEAITPSPHVSSEGLHFIPWRIRLCVMASALGRPWISLVDQVQMNPWSSGESTCLVRHS